MKDLEFSDNGEGAIDFSEILPDQFIVTDKEIDQELYEQFMTELEWIDPQPAAILNLNIIQSISVQSQAVQT